MLKMKRSLVALSMVAALGAAQKPQSFTGTISDDMCAKADHSGMQMGSNDAECTIACVSAHGAGFVLYDGKNTYKLSSNRSVGQLAGRRVTVTGVLDPKTQTIQIASIAPAK